MSCVWVGNTSRAPASIDPALLTGRLLTLRGISLSTQMARGGVMPQLRRIMELFGQGKLRTVLDRVFPLRPPQRWHRPTV